MRDATASPADSKVNFHAHVAANALRMVQRELQADPPRAITAALADWGRRIQGTHTSDEEGPMTTLETLLSDPETPGVWNLVAARSSVAFKTRSLWGLTAVKGTFTDFSGDGQITAKGAVFGRLDIRAASLQTGIGKRDEHLRSAEFFDVVTFPTISVVVTAMQPTSGSEADLRATLAVRRATKPLPLHVTVSAQDDGTVRISGQTKIDRMQWEVAGNLFGMVGTATTLTADTVFARVNE